MNGISRQRVSPSKASTEKEEEEKKKEKEKEREGERRRRRRKRKSEGNAELQGDAYQSFIEDLISGLNLGFGELSQWHLLQVDLKLDQVCLHSLHVEDEADQLLNLGRQLGTFA